MLLTFIDETGDSKDKEYLGFSVATINAHFYSNLKTEVSKILLDIGWDPSTEFKGSYLFSASKGCADVEVEQRVEAAKQLLDLNIAKYNSRMRFYYGCLHSKNHSDAYLTYLPPFLTKILPKAKPSKNLILVSCDERSDITEDQLNHALIPAIENRGYVIHERVQSSKSTFETIGLMFADVVGYLTARIDTISHDAELFEDVTPEKLESNGKLRKLQSSSELISRIKQINVYKYNE